MITDQNSSKAQSMNKEIGSEFWLSSLPERNMQKTPSWLPKLGHAVLTSTGRGAISLMLAEVGELVNKSVLLPSYVCESVVTPFARKGYTCYFYDVDSDLAPEVNSIRNFSNVGIFLHMGYFGFPTNSVLLDVVTELAHRGTIIVEDITHTLFSDLHGFLPNDYYVASLRKWIGLPSGGVLISAKHEVKTDLVPVSHFDQLRKEALLLKGVYQKTGDLMLKPKYRALFTEAEEWLETNVEPYSIDTLSLTLANLIDVKQVKDKRRRNFEWLVQGLDNPMIDPLVEVLEAEICPLFFPVSIRSGRSDIQRHLAREGIYCPIHWRTPSHPNLTLTENSKRIYDTILSVPCDQRYDKSDMGRILEVVNCI